MPSDADAARAATFDGVSVDRLAHELALPSVIAYREIGSTLDVAHQLAADGLPAGTLIVADAQSAGRGRFGRSWTSEPGAGVWLTLVERPPAGPGVGVLSLRVGLALAGALDAFAEHAIRLKWPNDLYVGNRKLGGILVEARWRDGALDWAAIGVGINVRVPAGEPNAVGLRSHARRADVLRAAVAAIRRVVMRSDVLDEHDLSAFAARDFASGRRCLAPVAGRVVGIDASGALLVDVGSGVTQVHGGSLVLQEDER